MISPPYTSYLEINLSSLKRVQVFVNSKYVFTVGVYKKEMGFYIDFPKFNKSESSISNYILPKEKKQIDKLTPFKSETKSICPKLSFHESGWVLLSKGGIFFDKTISRQKSNESIFNNTGTHVFSISLQNIDKLPNETPSGKNKVAHVSLPFFQMPNTIKFIGNLWKKEDLKKDFPFFNSLKNGMEFPIIWPRKDGSNIGDIILVFKLCHIKESEPMFLTIRCMPVPILDHSCVDSTLLSLMSGFIFEDMIDLKKETNFFGLIAKN